MGWRHGLVRVGGCVAGDGLQMGYTWLEVALCRTRPAHNHSNWPVASCHHTVAFRATSSSNVDWSSSQQTPIWRVGCTVRTDYRPCTVIALGKSRVSSERGGSDRRVVTHEPRRQIRITTEVWPECPRPDTNTCGCPSLLTCRSWNLEGHARRREWTIHRPGTLLSNPNQGSQDPVPALRRCTRCSVLVRSCDKLGSSPRVRRLRRPRVRGQCGVECSVQASSSSRWTSVAAEL
ncbi:hypothetical protein K466DRAFT_370944 [Polyporus arcularius HHB13444]|uniref:Uncharacterized protein n=1 Tax=Polyporus arcularius HHB13444 TaxID=1314778 RepID=A0A5C3PMY5_9APHY|nr:hypothetical protein K466DRAFT_370944 [Polyporus arcularius HHB13444]